MTLEEERAFAKSLRDKKWGGEFNLMELLRFPAEKENQFAAIDVKKLFSLAIADSIIAVDDSDDDANKKNNRNTFSNKSAEKYQRTNNLVRYVPSSFHDTFSFYDELYLLCDVLSPLS